MNVNLFSLDAGEPTGVLGLVPAAWAECPEMAWGGSAADMAVRVQSGTEANTRVELLATDQNGHLVGCCVLVPDEDQHVGSCLGVMWNYVLPEYRGDVGRRFMRLAIQVARQWGFSTLAYTHRTGIGKYAITYRRLHGQIS